MSQLYSTVGKEFWISFPPITTGDNKDNAKPIIYITGMRNCTGKISNKSGTFIQNFTVTAGKQTELFLPLDLFYMDNPEIIESKGAFVESSDSIQVVLASGSFGRTEFANVIPVKSLGSDYFVLTYANGGNTFNRSQSYFMILGVEDNTEIEIYPTQESSLGTKPQKILVTMNKGDVYLYEASIDLDLTGSQIHAKNCKPIVVYSGALRTLIPLDCQKPINSNGLFEQNQPLNTLGTTFLINHSPQVEKEYIKILATKNNTQININGILVAVLNAGSVYEGYLTESSFIKTSKPVITGYFGIGFCSLVNQPIAGIFMIYATPLEQAITYSNFITELYPLKADHRLVQIYIRTKDKEFTILDGKNISSNFSSFKKNPEYSYAQIKIDSGAHTLINKNGFLADVTGLSNLYGAQSYGYSAGSLLNKSNQYASVNGNSSNLQKEFLFCPMQAVNFEAVRQDTVFSKVFWHFDDGSIDSGNVVNKTFKDTGCHQVQMISYYSGSSGNCLLGNGATDTTFLKVCVVNSLPLSIGNDTGFCRNRPLTLQSNINPDGFSYLWSTGATSSAISVTETGNYWLELKNGNCAIRDSVQVTVVDKPVLSIQGDKLLCSGDSILLQNSVNSPTVTYTWNNGKKGYSQWINKPGLYSLSGIDRGCYSETSINIGELSCPEIYVPTGFTPDGDGRNDIIRPICAGIDLVYFRVYNRYGQMIFETREDGKGWNGKLNGIQQSMATYVYVVEGRDKSGRQHIRKGTFVLIR